MPAYLYHHIVNAHRNYSAVNQVSMVIPGPLSGQREFDAKASYCPCAPVPARQDCLVVVLQSTIIQCSRFRQYAISPGDGKALRHSDQRSHAILQGLLVWGTYMDHHGIYWHGSSWSSLLETVRWTRLLWAYLTMDLS